MSAKSIYTCLLVILTLFIHAFSHAIDTGSITSNVKVIQGPVNGVQINQNGKTLLIYGDPREEANPTDMVLFTHFRRDAVWAGRDEVEAGARAWIPAAEKQYFTACEAFWDTYPQKRFRDLSMRTSKVPVASLANIQSVTGGDRIEWEGMKIGVVSTPGYTFGAVSYVFESDSKKIACVGDLIYGDGQILDLYSLQNAIPACNTGGYHGYMGRAKQVIESLRNIAEEEPDILVPARGPVVYRSQQAIDKLIGRLQTIYENYLSICALRWYWGDEYIQCCAERMLGREEIDGLPIAKVQEQTPGWLLERGTSRILVSRSGKALLIDCGGKRTLRDVQSMIAEGKFKAVDAIYVTHYHSDHTNAVAEAAKTFECPVYATPIQADLLQNPSKYHMPVQSANAIPNICVMQDGEQMVWREFTLTFYDYPGQTLYHSGLLARRDTGERYFFIGDSFTPYGIDDYCLLNRNFLHAGMGYNYCLRMLQGMQPNYYLINEHVKDPFRFSQAQLDRMMHV
ncbi:MBL fold metallo-hydrolase, partial [bacterium]|nr:MBL fold metallo-hydrolase [bacterium]